ncbi:MAG: hypothetical protein K0S61_4904 [Anaerocolumna sp.]|jgi:hypothetical protein|nr:hypothetical protein [Anaerocolumna sp.]
MSVSVGGSGGYIAAEVNGDLSGGSLCRNIKDDKFR